MAAPKGNEFWKARTRHGRKGTFQSEEELLKACMEYFEWLEKNPLYEAKLVSYQGESTIKNVPMRRVASKWGLATFLGVDASTWWQWGQKDDANGLSNIVARVNQLIQHQMFEGAASEQFNPMLIARYLGLSEKTDNNHRSDDGTMSPSKVDETVVKALVDKLLD